MVRMAGSRFQYTTIEGGNVDAEEIEAAKADLDQRTFRPRVPCKVCELRRHNLLCV